MIAFNPNHESLMSNVNRQGRNALAIACWGLWIDAVGSFRVLEGNEFTIGGIGGNDPADIAIRSAWRSQMATLHRMGEELWLRAPHRESLISSSGLSPEPLSITAPDATQRSLEPQVRIHHPSPLSRTAVVTIDPPHRFVAPVDAILLVQGAVLLGADKSNHIRATHQQGEPLVMTKRGEQWRVKGPDGLSILVNEGERIEVGSLVMTLRRER